MSVIFGIKGLEGSLANKQSLLRMSDATRQYGADGTSVLIDGSIGMGFQPFHTHARSRLEYQPKVDPNRNIIVLDGRLDNHEELAEIEGAGRGGLSDSDLILKAFERWGEHCFSRLIGDWALALWCASERVLYLARDHAGTRNLFYEQQSESFKWSSYLETFFVMDGWPELDREYLIRLLAHQQVRDHTPLKHIRSVPPAHYLVISGSKIQVRRHWNWIATKRIVYRSDDEYDEQFLYLFRQAVERRIGEGAPVLAELSGGMDSSSIVCMADKINRSGSHCGDPLDTVSYYLDSEPDWDERPYFTSVERFRNRKGIHLDLSSQVLSFQPLVLPGRIYPYPAGDRSYLDLAYQFEQSVGPGRYRAILSGIGGDELLGGVPTPLPELADYIRRVQPLRLLTAATEWCMETRTPLVNMIATAFQFTRDIYRPRRFDPKEAPPWLSSEARQICLRPHRSLSKRLELVTAYPSELSNGKTWWAILETLPSRHPHFLSAYEYRYPYLDRDLVDFLHCIPREVLIRPGRRRLLMRRALKGIVPTEVIERKRKAFISRTPVAELRAAQERIEQLFFSSELAKQGLIDRDRFIEAFRAELKGNLRWLGHLKKAIEIELWLQSLLMHSVMLQISA